MGFEGRPVGSSSIPVVYLVDFSGCCMHGFHRSETDFFVRVDQAIDDQGEGEWKAIEMSERVLAQTLDGFDLELPFTQFANRTLLLF